MDPVTERRSPLHVPEEGGAGPALQEAVGGPLGVAESAAPATVFVIAFSIAGQDANTSAIAALVVGVVFGVARMVRGQTVQFALSGIVGVAIAAFVVSRTGKAEDFFLPGLLINAAYALGYAISILVRWPLIGLILETATGRGTEWRKDSALVRRYSRISWIWVGLFSLRLAVQLPMYLAGAVTVLGVARVAMGIPLFALGVWVSWLLLRDTPVTAEPAHP